MRRTYCPSFPNHEELSRTWIAPVRGHSQKATIRVCNESGRPFDLVALLSRLIQPLAAVRLKNKWGYIDRTDRMIIPPQFEEAEEFDENGIAAAIRRGRRGSSIEEGKLWFHSDMITGPLFRGGLVRLQVDERWGLCRSG